MFALTRVIPTVVNYMNRLTNISYKSLQPTSQFHSLTSAGSSLNPGGLFSLVTRNKVRVYFPRPNEVRRIRRHGWKTRMSTLSGRRIIMNRILKGRFVYTH